MKTLAYGFCGKINFMDTAIRQQLKKVKVKVKDKKDRRKTVQVTVDTFLGEDTNLNKTICALVRKYLSNYQDDEIRYDIVMSAFEYVFMKNLNKAFEKFDGTYEGREIAIEAYINTLMARAIINASKEQLKHIKDKMSISPIEDETLDQAFDRVVYNSKRRGQIRNCSENLEEIAQIKKERAELKKRYVAIYNDEKLFEKDYNTWWTRLDRIEKSLKKGLHRQQELQGYSGKCVLHEAEDLHQEFTVDEEIQFEKLVEKVKRRSKSKDQLRITSKILDMLLAGFNQKEIAVYLEESAMTISRYVTLIKEAVKDLAQEAEEWDNDTDLMQTLKMFTLKGSTSVSKNTIVTDREVHRQVYYVFGNLMDK